MSQLLGRTEFEVRDHRASDGGQGHRDRRQRAEKKGYQGSSTVCREMRGRRPVRRVAGEDVREFDRSHQGVFALLPLPRWLRGGAPLFGSAVAAGHTAFDSRRRRGLGDGRHPRQFCRWCGARVAKDGRVAVERIDRRTNDRSGRRAGGSPIESGQVAGADHAMELAKGCGRATLRVRQPGCHGCSSTRPRRLAGRRKDGLCGDGVQRE